MYVHKILETRGSAACDGGGAVTPRNTSLSTCVIVPNLVALSQTVWALVGGTKNFGHAGAPPLRMGAWLICRHTPLPRVIVPNLVVLRACVWRSTGKTSTDLSRSAFQGHSKLLEPTWISRLRMTSCSNLGPILYRS